MSKKLTTVLVSKLDTGELLSIIDESLSATEVLRKLGYSNKGQYVSVVREFIHNNDIYIGHFTTNGKPSNIITKKCICCNKEFRTEKRSEKEQTTCSRACSNTYYRSGSNNSNYTTGIGSYRKLAIDHYGAICKLCGYSNIDALEVHHIDKNRDNNTLSNLEVLCCNCHTLVHKCKT